MKTQTHAYSCVRAQFDGVTDFGPNTETDLQEFEDCHRWAHTHAQLSPVVVSELCLDLTTTALDAA